jgi:ketosteroid isomerase-like protein
MKGLFAVALVLVLVSLMGQTPRGTVSADKGALVAADLAVAKATAERGLEGWLSWFAADARIFPPGEPVIEGIEAIKAYYRKTGFDPKPLSWKPAYADLAASGDLGYTVGYASWPATDDKGQRVTRGSKYLTVWKKQADGSWKVAADMGNASPPMNP